MEIRREDDDELLGFIVERDAGWVPTTVFGSPVAEPTDEADAEQTLRSHGLAYLAARWEMRDGDAWLSVQVVEASPDGATVQIVDFAAAPDRYGERRRFAAPAGDDLRLVGGHL